MTSEEDGERISRRLVAAFVQFRRLRPDMYGGTHCDREHCLRHSEVMILFGVKESEARYPDGVSVTDLSGYLRLKSPTITPSVYRLEKEGLVERRVDSSDRRIVRIRLTEEGKSYIHSHVQRFAAHIRGLVNYLGEEKSNTLADLLNEVYQYASHHHSQDSQ